MPFNIFSGLNSDGLFLSRDSMYVYDGGAVNSTTVDYYAMMYVSATGTANYTTVNSRGFMYVFSGGIANDTLITGGSLPYEDGLHLSGGVANRTTIQKGYVYVSSGGTANSNTIHFWGHLRVSSGGTANSTTVYSSGALGVYGGTAYNTILNSSGALYVEDGYASITTVNSSGYMEIRSGGTAISNTINSDGHLYFESCGMAISTTINPGGYMGLHSGGTANITTVSSGGKIVVSSGGTATGLSLEEGAFLSFTVAPDTHVQGTRNGSAFVTEDAFIADCTIDSDFYFTLSNGTAAGTIVNSGGHLIISSGGIANDTTVNGYGVVIREGIANRLTINSGGDVVISRGGTANSATVYFGGSMSVLSGGTMNSVTFYSGADVRVYSGGYANYVTVNSDCQFSIVDGAKVAYTTVNRGGYLYVRGTTEAIIENGGYVSLGANVNVTFASNTFSGIVLEKYDLATVHSGTTAYNTTIQYLGDLRIYSGGTAINTIVASGADMTLYSDGIANYTTIFSRAQVFVASGATMNYTTINAGADVRFSSGVTANYTTVNAGGWIDVSNGVITNNTTVNAGGHLHVYSGGTAYDVVLNGGDVVVDEGAVVSYVPNIISGLVLSGTSASLPSGTIANDTTICSSGYLEILGGIANRTTIDTGALDLSSGTANDTAIVGMGFIFVSNGVANSNTVHSGWLYLSSGGTANFNTVNHGGIINVRSGGTANYTLIDDEGGNGRIFVSGGGVANDTTIIGTDLCGCESYISSGGVANRTILDGWSILIVEGVANSTTVVSHGAISVRNGGKAIHTVVANKNYGMCPTSATGVMHIDPFGSAFDTIVEMSGYLCVWGDGIVSETTVKSGGYMCINAFGSDHWNSYRSWKTSSGGVAYDTTINAYGTLLISYGGTAHDTTVDSRGTLRVFSGGTVTGQMNFARGATVAFSAGAVLNFDISSLSPGNSTARVSNLATVRGVPVYTLTVSASQADGVYSLADNASTFDSTISVVNTSGVRLGSLSVGETVNIGGDSYTLCRNKGNLRLSINAEIIETTPASEAVSEQAKDVLLPHQLPEAEYMYGCTPTAVGMILGYYDLYGYGSAGFSNMIEGDVDLKSRGTDWDVYNMNAFDTALGRAIASEKYVFYFYSRYDVATTPEQELPYAFQSGSETLDTSRWDCIAAYLGTGQYWRGNDNLSTRNVPGTLQSLYEFDRTATTETDETLVYSYAYDPFVTITDGTNTRTIRFIEGCMEYGLDQYVQSRGYRMDDAITGTYVVDVNEGSFTFADYMREIDAGRPVLIHIDGHSMAGYGYNEDTEEIIFDDCYENGQRMVWGGTYHYADEDRKLRSVTIIALDESSGDSVTFSARGDRDGNGVSDVMFVWTGNNYAHGYWMNGTSEWWSANSTGVSADWDNLGSYDMSGDGKADAVMFGNVVVNDAKGAYIGYYQDGDDANGWVNIGFLDNSANTDWKNVVGNLTGGTANSIVWYAPELYALGAWTDGTDSWVTLGNTFGGDDWTLVGCSDFDGDGKDSVLMTYNNGQMFYTADLDGTAASLGSLNWSGWDVRAIGDFAGDGKDDIVLFHAETGSMVMLANGSADDYASIGQLDPADWFVAGCGDYNGDGADDLLVRQYSTGMLGYYSNGDTSQWNVLGYGVDMSWTVIA